MEVAPIDQRHLDGRLSQRPCRVQSAESPTDDHDPVQTHEAPSGAHFSRAERFRPVRQVRGPAFVVPIGCATMRLSKTPPRTSDCTQDPQLVSGRTRHDTNAMVESIPVRRDGDARSPRNGVRTASVFRRTARWVREQPAEFLELYVVPSRLPGELGPGSLQLLNLPPTFQPGNTYDLLVRLQNPGQRRWGFELTVLGPANEQAGQIVVTDAVATQLSDNPGTMADYIKHTTDGTYAGTMDGPVTWSFQWVAPNLPNVQFYLAGNAADESKDPGGDYIYTLQASLDQGTVSALPTTGVRSRRST